MSVKKHSQILLLSNTVPVSIAAHFFQWGELTVFITAALAILPLAADELALQKKL